MKYAYAKFDAADFNYSELYRNSYDEQNRLTEVRDCDNKIIASKTYDGYDRITARRYGKIGVSSTYDAIGMKTNDKFTYSDGGERIYAYEYTEDSAKNLRGITTSRYTEEYETDGLGRTTKIGKRLDGYAFTERYGFYKNGDHATSRVNSITYAKDGVLDGKITYTYDKKGNIISVNEDGRQRNKYNFDTIGRIVSEKDLDKNKEVCYNYDNQGNIESKRSSDGTVKIYYYEDGTDLLVKFGTERIVYDKLGNPVVYRDMPCVWDKSRLLKSVHDGTNTVQFTYDVFGRRTSKTCNSTVTEFEYDESKLIRQVSDDGIIEFIYGKNGIVGFVHNDKAYCFRKNLFGDVERIYDKDGKLVGKYSYTAFGECTIELDEGNIASLNPIRYRGYYFDDELGLYYLESRYYDPEIGRFISPDSIEYIDPEYVNGLNLYAYCDNNPIMAVDKRGFSPSVNVGVDVWAAYKSDNYYWRSGRYSPKRVFKYGKNSYKYIGNNLLYMGEVLLNRFELKYYRVYSNVYQVSDSGATLFSHGTDILTGVIYVGGENDYIGATIGRVGFNIGDINPQENRFVIIDAEVSLLALGIYSEYADLEFLVGSFGLSLKVENGYFTFAFSAIFGLKITFKLW